MPGGRWGYVYPHAVINCLWCGKQKRVSFSEERKGARFCSHPCANDYWRGRPKGPLKRKTLEELFWPKVQKGDSEGDCWVWTGGVDGGGYGCLKAASVGKHTLKAHRVSWEMHNGPIPEGLCVLHRCDNPPCANPNHLFLGTYLDNARDMVTKGRQNHPTPKLDLDYIPIIRRWLAEGDRQKHIAQCFGVSHTAIRRIAIGVTFAHVP